ncbi:MULTISPECIES: hypothetical protein [Rhizobium/Agrobacterium group]|jgi:hypothetical protein|uniref:Uncharacterized protein n=1 Tax=Agrobacterium tumefaciens TaxID=358 RepID=A0AAJ4N098_AGRTU|nr:MULTISPECIES: hypothetical protein [Rhizobium/Agrobacterium group]MDP9759949.1 hypothetical protein [Agrobacterium tumefaciens]MDQ1222767.1 hypothetical protein [Agrobacterium sp. SORGH_AS_0745]MDX8325292.1 hypothetical protein [Agrobacterium tumefaciens]MEA1840483.1 hypothetical protein [Agrobacterium tumefaciens]NIB55189.1 hypothetical protein [Agrobacterium tumefaciens]
MRLTLNKNGFHRHHIQSRDGSPQKSGTGFCSCDIQAAETKTARFPEETAPFQNPSFMRSAYGLPKMYVNARNAAKPASARKVTAQQDF